MKGAPDLARARRIAKRMGLSVRTVRVRYPKIGPIGALLKVGITRLSSPLLGTLSIPS